MSLLTNRCLMLAKIESSYGTDPSPTASADAVAVENLEISFPVDVIHPKVAKPSLSPIAPIHGRKTAVFEFDVPIKGSGSAGTAADWGPLLRACGALETVNAGVDVTYTPEDNPNTSSVTIYAYKDGVLYEANGCRGNVALMFAAGERAMFRFSMTGIPVDAVDASLPTPTFDSTIAQLVQGASFSIGGFSAVIQELTMDVQNAIQPADSVNASGGYQRIDITDRDPQGSMNPEATLIATHDWWSDWEDSTQQALTITVGATAGNIATFTAPAVVDRELELADRNGIMVHPIPVSFAQSSGDDEWQLVMT